MKLLPLLTHVHAKQGGLYLPAHGRGSALPNDFRKLFKTKPGYWDLPELPDIGGVFEKSGAIYDSQMEAAKNMGTKKAWFGVNGATGLLQASLLAIANPGSAVLIPRNSHKSLIDACVLGNLLPVLYETPFLCDRGHYSPPDSKWLKKILEESKSQGLEIVAAVLIHPSYHGYASDITPLIDLLHCNNLPVLVDEAHGTYFAFIDHPKLPKSSLAAGADLVVHSLHKSGLGLCQTAVLWLQGTRVDPSELERTLNCLQTTSPSALLLASCELAINEWLYEPGKKKIIKRLKEAKQIFCRLKEGGVPLLKTEDPLRLILQTSSIGLSGIEADKWFMEQGIYGELPEPATLTFCLGFTPRKGITKSLQNHWKKLVSNFGQKKPINYFPKPPHNLLTIPTMPPGSAIRAKSQKLKLVDAIDKVSTQMIYPYPPGIPLVIPGEVLNRQLVQWLLEQRNFWPNEIPAEISVLS